MKESRIYVDFNEMVEYDLVLLSQSDAKLDSAGNLIELYEGLSIKIYMDDVDESGNIDNLIAEGIVEPNKITEGWGKKAKWCCRIDKNDIRNESDRY